MASYYRRLGFPVPPSVSLYDGRASLPADPRTLVTFLGTHAGGPAADHSFAAFSIIIDPRTYQFLGLKHWDPTGKTIMGIAVLQQALVSGPGIRP